MGHGQVIARVPPSDNKSNNSAPGDGTGTFTSAILSTVASSSWLSSDLTTATFTNLSRLVTLSNQIRRND